MKAKISASTVAKMRPGDVINDVEIKGFAARCWSTGSITYSLRYGTRSGRKRIKIGRHGHVTPHQARVLAQRYAGEIAAGLDPARQTAAAGTSVATIWDDYARRELTKKRSGRAQAGAFDRLVRPRLGERSIYDLRRSDMTKLFDGIADNNGVVMADRMLAYLGVCFHWQQVRDDEFVSPIVKGMRRTTTKDLARDRILTDVELRAVWHAAQDTFGALVRFLLLTGARRNEASRMVWSELDGSIWTLPASRSKTKVEQVRPLSGAAMSIIEAQPRHGDYVFGVAGKAISSFATRKEKLNADSGTTGWRLHDIRRTSRSLMSRAGVSADVGEVCLGHALPGVRSVYDRYGYMDEKRDAFERLAELVEQITASP
jgi:integrase